MRPAVRNIAVTRGDTYQHLVTFTDAAGDPLDITANTYTAQLRANPESLAVLAEMTATAGATGEVWLTIDPAVTADLVPGRRTWDLQEVDGDGIVTTIMAGWADVVADVTREEV